MNSPDDTTERLDRRERLEVLADTFGEALKANDRDKFMLCTFDDMQDEIRDIQSIRARHGILMNMNRIHHFLVGIQGLNKVLTLLEIPHTERAMAYVWGSIRYLLKSTNDTDRAFDGVLDIYERLGTRLPPLFEYEQMFNDCTDSRECLVNIYDDVQRFHLLAYKLFSLRPKLWQRLYNPVWKDLDKTFTQLLTSLDSHGNIIRTHGEVIRNHGARLQNPVTGLYGGVPGTSSLVYLCDSIADLKRYTDNWKQSWRTFKDMETVRKREQGGKVTRWISSSNKIEEMQKEFREMRVCPGSGRWLFRRYKQVAKWMREDDSSEPAIWLHGSKGFGKTILASLIVDELESYRTRETPVIPVSSKTYYFFCQEEDDDHRTHLDILKGLLRQMVAADLRHIQEVGNDPKQSSAADVHMLALCEDKVTHTGGDFLSNAETAQSLIEPFVDYSRRQYIIIDGLDECEVAEARQTAEFFKALVRRHNREVNGLISGGDGETKRGRLRVMYTSQPMVELESYMPVGGANIALKTTDNAEDIREYVRMMIPTFGMAGDTESGFNLSPGQQKQMEDTICDKSEAMFLYAHLTVEYLKDQPTKGELLNKINDVPLPNDLSEIYERLLGSIKAKLSGPQWEKARLLLGWLVCAKRSLKWHEMQSILAFDPSQRAVDFDNNMLRHHMRKYLGSLVHLMENGGHIRLIHSTARKHIVQNRHINKEEVQYKLATLCLQYLSLPAFIIDYPEDDRKKDARRGWFSFQDYACSQWHSHIDTVIRECRDFLSSNSGALSEFSSALAAFLSAHGSHLTTDHHASLYREHIDKLSHLPIYAPLLTLWNHVFTHQSGTFAERSKIDIPQIETSVLANRAALETFQPTGLAVNNDKISDYYGPNLFKCHRTLCRFFHLGYDSYSARKEHDSRHDRPYACLVNDCKSAPIGFSTCKDKDRHVRIYHPELIDGLSAFESLSRRQAAGTFNCRLCQKSFTRKVNLQGHERSHFDDRPYACPTCPKKFARVHDCRRHQKTHARHRGVL